MFRDRPLTWLFVIATVCVDMFWMAKIAPNNSRLLLYAGLGGVLAQSVAIAVGSIYSHRTNLTCASIVVVGNAVLAFISFKCMGSDDRTWLAFFTLHASLSVIVAIVTRAIRAMKRDGSLMRTWRVSVVEMFGWTILVAILSFGLRFSDFDGLNLTGSIRMLAPSVAFTLAALWGLRQRPLRTTWIRVASPLMVSFAIIALLEMQARGTSTDEAKGLFCAYGAYLCGWIFVDRMDNRSVPVQLQTDAV